MDNITPELVRALRARAQHLWPKAARGDLIGVVHSLCGVNVQSAPAMMLSLRARIEGLEAAGVEDAMRRRLLVCTWAMRGTIHLLDSGDLFDMVSILGPALIKKGERRRRELGLDDDKLADSLREMPAILKGGPLTRDELVDELIKRGIGIDPEGQAPYHLVAYAGLKGLIYICPDRTGGEQTYCLADKHASFNRERALAEITRRYLASYGPAGPGDLASWSGLSAADAKKGWELAGEKRELKVGGQNLWATGAQLQYGDTAADTVVNLLPAFDTLVLGYKDREFLVPKKYQEKVYHGGQTVPVVLVNGLASGTWRYERRGKSLKVNVRPFEPFDGDTAALAREEADDVGRFFGLRAEVSGL